MVHSGAQCADSLCQLNRWGRTTVPLHALELGLRQLQLDTVTFFLCTKENGKPVEPEISVSRSVSVSKSVTVSMPSTVFTPNLPQVGA